ncbi:MAG: FtsX-like permease family protein [Pirellulales bacterium]|nr:FtsX-like permease family protein [Pirellulales bacterium]
MYKILLCLRYLRTRWIALASIISVMLGVATMIVVNSVMSGFTHEMMTRLRGSFADLIFESTSLDGFPDADWHMAKIREVGGDRIVGVTPTVHVPSMLSFQVNGQWINRQIVLIGVDPATQASASDLSQNLLHAGNRQKLSFDLREGGFDLYDRQAPAGEAQERTDLKHAGWEYRRFQAERRKALERTQQAEAALREQQALANPSPAPLNPAAGNSSAPVGVPTDSAATDSAAAPVTDPFAQRATQPEQVFDPAKEQFTGIILGKELIFHDALARFLVIPGDDVKISFPTVGHPPKILSDNFTVVDIYESKMTGHDGNFVFVPLRQLQEMRGMIDPATGSGRVNAIQIRVRDGVDVTELRAEMAAAFSKAFYKIETWQEKVGPLLAAVAMEKQVLNILLFLIIAVAGFGILAIFFMIVVEKTKDIGILKSLGASRQGIMGIFLGYGLSLGIVGSGVGLILGLIFVWNINTIRDLLEYCTGQRVFDPSIYYFYKIPTVVEPLTVGWIVLGALVIAVLASVLPAIRAANLHPVEALRYE